MRPELLYNFIVQRKVMDCRRLGWLYFFAWTVFYIEGSTEPCLHLVFPDLDTGLVLTAAENITVSLTFHVQEVTPGCFKDSFFRLGLDKVRRCTMLYSDGRFSPREIGCTATLEEDTFQFTFPVYRFDDKKTLRWGPHMDEVAREKTVVFNITCPAPSYPRVNVRPKQDQGTMRLTLGKTTGVVSTSEGFMPVTKHNPPPTDTTVSVRRDDVTKQDQGTWRQTLGNETGNGNSSDGFLPVAKDNAAEVTSLTLYSDQTLSTSPVNTNSPIDIVCTWDAGNPPVRATLLDRHGVEMEGSNTSDGPLRQIRYRFAAVGCQDAGLIRCQAPGASHNKTATLLVKCVPEIHLDQSIEQSDGALRVTLNVRSFTSALHCKAQSSTTGYPCTVSAVTGSPPDLTVSVRLDNVTTQDQGTWRLTLTNYAGSGYTEFRPHVSTGANMGVIAITVAVVLVAGLIVISVTVITVVCLKKGFREDGLQTFRHLEAAVQQPALPDDVNRYSMVCERRCSDIYDKISDGPEGIPLATKPSSPLCSAPCEDDGYLQPLPLLPDRPNTARGTPY